MGPITPVLMKRLGNGLKGPRTSSLIYSRSYGPFWKIFMAVKSAPVEMVFSHSKHVHEIARILVELDLLKLLIKIGYISSAYKN